MQVAIVQEFISHYRWSVFNLLSKQEKPMPEYVIFSGEYSSDNIKGLDTEKAKMVPLDGGLNWEFLRNYKIGKFFLWQSKVINLTLSDKFDAIIFPGNVYHISTWLCLLISKFKNKKIILWTHGFIRNENNIKGFIRNMFYRISDKILLYGNNAKKIMESRGFDSKKLQVIYNSLDYDKQIRVRISIEEEANERVNIFKNKNIKTIIFVGRLTKQKKLSMILEALFNLVKDDFYFNLLFVGDGPEKNNLYNKTIDYGLQDYVYFYGSCYCENKLGTLIYKADLCVSPGEVGLTCMHALVYGTPVITHGDSEYQMPEFEAVQPGVTGALFLRDDVGSLAEKIREWLLIQTNREQVRQDCFAVIDKYYNPYSQVSLINQAILSLSR